MDTYRTTGDIKKKRYIRSLLILQGIEIADIAADVGVTPTMVGNTIAGKRKSIRVRKAVAEALGVPITDLWPEENGKISQRRRRSCRTK
jgi:transcriptional regulator with XRE-family HTH domain